MFQIQVVGASSHNQKVAGSIPSQDTVYIGCRLDLVQGSMILSLGAYETQSGSLWETTNRYFSLTWIFSLSLSPFLSPYK